MAMWWRLSVLGLIGVASLLLVPMEEFLPVSIAPAQLRLMAIVQPALLVFLFAAVGVWVGPGLGLDAPTVRASAEGRPILPELRRQFPSALVAGLAVAAILFAYVAVLRPTETGGELLRFAAPLASRLLYGGLAEEVLMRWGLMSLLVWLAWRIGGRAEPVPAWCYLAGLILSALLFAVGHLPALSLLLPNAPGWLVTLVLAANFFPGLLFGWLFWRRGLEAAMMAHALAHLFGATAIWLFD